MNAIPSEQTAVIAKALAKLLGDSYTLYLKTHNFHWNVTGPQFASLHLLFEQEYLELALAVDEIAERIRALGHPAPGSYAQFIELSKIKEETTVPDAANMISQLMIDQRIVVQTAKQAYDIAEKAQDHATLDLVTRRILTHEKNAWMLESLLE